MWLYRNSSDAPRADADDGGTGDDDQFASEIDCHATSRRDLSLSEGGTAFEDLGGPFLGYDLG